MPTPSSPKNLSNLIKAFNIFLKYGDISYPTICEHDVLIVRVDPARVSGEDTTELEVLGFIAEAEDECFKSYAYGSA